jgi:hypothetical protein
MATNPPVPLDRTDFGLISLMNGQSNRSLHVVPVPVSECVEAIERSIVSTETASESSHSRLIPSPFNVKRRDW